MDHIRHVGRFQLQADRLAVQVMQSLQFCADEGLEEVLASFSEPIQVPVQRRNTVRGMPTSTIRTSRPRNAYAAAVPVGPEPTISTSCKFMSPDQKEALAVQKARFQGRSQSAATARQNPARSFTNLG